MTSSDEIRKPAYALGLAGLIPFIVTTIAIWWLPDFDRFSAQTVLLAYGAVILSFLGGVKWGSQILSPPSVNPVASVSTEPKTPNGQTALVLSVIPSLIGWLALLLNHSLGLSLLLVGFVTQYFLDRQSVRRKELPPWYGRLRLLLSSIVSLCLILSLLQVLLN